MMITIIMSDHHHHYDHHCLLLMLKTIVAISSVPLLEPQLFTLKEDIPSPSSSSSSPATKVPLFIEGKFLVSQSTQSNDVFNPATQELVTQVPFTTNEEFKAAVCAATKAFPAWRDTPISARQRVMLKFRELIRKNIDMLALIIVTEQGKTLKDAEDGIFHGLDLVQYACELATLQLGAIVSSHVSTGYDSYNSRKPLGVCAGICSSSSQALIPLWMFPIAITCGNTFILKPLDNESGVFILLAKFALEAGLPNGVLNIIHGSNDLINAICDDDDIQSVSFVGPKSLALDIYSRVSPRGKRVQCNVEAKNHAIVMQDANFDGTIETLVTCGLGTAGQKRMAVGCLIFVGDSQKWENKLVECAKKLKVNIGTLPDVDLGPFGSKQEHENIYKLIEFATEAGSKLLLDGRAIVVPGYESGNFIGPTILSNVNPRLTYYMEEIFAPILLCMQVDSLEEAIDIVNSNKYVNGVSIFTSSSATVLKFQTGIDVGQIGVNVLVRPPLPFFSLMGNKACSAGKLNSYGSAEVEFYTQLKLES